MAQNYSDSGLDVCLKVAILSHRVRHTKISTAQAKSQLAHTKEPTIKRGIKLTLHRSKAKSYSELHKRLFEAFRKGLEPDNDLKTHIGQLSVLENKSVSPNTTALVSRLAEIASLDVSKKTISLESEKISVLTEKCSFIDLLLELTSSGSLVYNELVQLRKSTVTTLEQPRIVEPEISYESLQFSELVSELYDISKDDIVFEMRRLAKTTTLSAYFTDLKQKLQILHYRAMDFDSKDNFDKWAKEETFQVKQLLDMIFPMVTSSEPGDLIPASSDALFERILERCLLAQNKVGPASDFYLDGGKLAFLDECCTLWRVDGFSIATSTLKIFLQVVCRNGDNIDLRNLPKGFELSRHFVTVSGVSPNVSRWPISVQDNRRLILKDIFITTLKAVAGLANTLPNSSAGLKRLLLLLEEKIFQDWSFKKESPRAFSELETVLRESAELCHNGLFLKYLAPPSSSLKELYSFFEDINIILQKFPMVFLGSPITGTFETRLGQLAFLSLKQKILDLRLIKSGISYGDVYVLYSKQLCPLRARLASRSAKNADLEALVGFSLETFLYPEIKEWAKEAQVKLLQQTDEIINTEQFTPHDDVKRSSHGVVLLFEQFNAVFQLLLELDWRDDKTKTKLYCTAVSGVCSCIEKYSHKMLQKIDRDAGSGKVSAASCVALNNLNAILENMNILEERTDFEYLSEIGSSQGDIKSSSSSLYMKVVGAENIISGGRRPPDLRVHVGSWGSTHIAYHDTDPRWNEEFRIKLDQGAPSIKIVLEDCAISKTLMESQYKPDLTSLSRDGIPKTLIFHVGTSGRLQVNAFFEIERNDPVFYMGRTRRVMLSAKDRALNIISSRFNMPIKEALSHETLKNTSDGAIKREDAMSPLCSFINSNFSILVQYLNLSTMDEVRMYVWSLALKEAEILVLPLLSSVRKVASKGAKAGISDLMRSVKISGFLRTMSLNDVSIVIFFVDDIKNTLFTRDEKLYEVPKYKQFSKIYDLYQASELSLKDKFGGLVKESVQFLSELGSVRQQEVTSSDITSSTVTPTMVMGSRTRRLTVSRNTEQLKSSGSANAYYEMNLVLRILLAKGNLSFVRQAVSRIDRLSATISTENHWLKLK
ncbi:unnamed protein product [Kuraishia capsulata CBS 1993]|uniref:C2 domain-containing protein n=1 Tax=Kuraishia capsulata CBS 1993 TaxID=1382522 RepID=W6MPY8_9ASCO|nr:uncharacterized protein KUCA_T00004774001 [Kuraishia capsulata CBS 1993]CDK28789.1 unnamed protein product [Kuraishia capsulata CBS 1993]